MPVVLVDPRTATAQLARPARRRCGFVLHPKPSAVYVSTTCRQLADARRGDEVALVALAAVVAHEAAHVGGADERQAQEQEQATFRRLALEHLPPDRRGAAMRYLETLTRRNGRP